jgi:hypothetical protein
MTYRPFRDIITAASTSSSSSIRSLLVNNSGTSIPALMPVRLNSSGQLEIINVSDDNSVLSIVGITEMAIPDWTQGAVITQGKLANVSVKFNFGDYIYVSKTGRLTNKYPVVGIDGFISGDFVIRVGVIAKNDVHPLQKDIFITIQIVGQL